MPYVGNEPTSNFASVTKDAFSGDGSTTAFTLSKAATTNGVAVFVENVRQEPTTAYAVSGTTLTFTAAPVSSSGNNIYVLHHNAPASTATHSASQPLTATSGTFTGDLTVDTNTLKVDSTNNKVGIGVTSPAEMLEVYNATSPAIQLNDGGDYQGIIRLAGNDLEIRGSSGALELYNGAADGDSSSLALKIDASGHVTKPLQPAFLVKPDANQDSLAINTYHTVQFDEEKFDQNGDFNTTNYTFTAPVTGRYQLNTSVYLYNVDEGADYYLIYIDTSNNDYSVIHDPGGYDGDINYQSWVVSMLADMDASDTAVVKVYQQAGSQQVNLIAGAYTWFSGYLVA